MITTLLLSKVLTPALRNRAQFAKWAGNSKTLRMEFFYRQMRQQMLGDLMRL